MVGRRLLQVKGVVEEVEEEAGSNASLRRHSNKGRGRRRQSRCSRRQPKHLQPARVTGTGESPMIGCMMGSKRRHLKAGRWKGVILARAG
jgi:hypothetical protein